MAAACSRRRFSFALAASEGTDGGRAEENRETETENEDKRK